MPTYIPSANKFISSVSYNIRVSTFRRITTVIVYKLQLQHYQCSVFWFHLPTQNGKSCDCTNRDLMRFTTLTTSSNTTFSEDGKDNGFEARIYFAYFSYKSFHSACHRRGSVRTNTNAFLRFNSLWKIYSLVARNISSLVSSLQRN